MFLSDLLALYPHVEVFLFNWSTYVSATSKDAGERHFLTPLSNGSGNESSTARNTRSATWSFHDPCEKASDIQSSRADDLRHMRPGLPERPTAAHIKGVSYPGQGSFHARLCGRRLFECRCLLPGTHLVNGVMMCLRTKGHVPWVGRCSRPLTRAGQARHFCVPE
jgi:hypothetical protein